MVKRYFWLAYMLLVTLAAVLTAAIVTSYLSNKLAMPITSQPTQARAAPIRQTRAAFETYQIIPTRNIFNASPPRAGEVAKQDTPPPEEPIKATELNLKLVGAATGASHQRYAIIEDLSKRGAQTVYQVGDNIQGASVVEINPNCVVLDKNRQYESLCFQHESSGPKTLKRQQQPSSSAATSQDTGGEGIIRVDNATWRVSRELILEQFSNLGALSDQARVAPYLVQGQTQGFRLTRLRAGSLLQQIGVQNGDVLQKVNGLSITSPNGALQAFQQLQNESTVRLEILRRKRATTLTYEIR
jgi:general secretion pathway protein C